MLVFCYRCGTDISPEDVSRLKPCECEGDLAERFNHYGFWDDQSFGTEIPINELLFYPPYYVLLSECRDYAFATADGLDYTEYSLIAEYERR